VKTKFDHKFKLISNKKLAENFVQNIYVNLFCETLSKYIVDDCPYDD